MDAVGGDISGDMFAYSALSVGYCDPRTSAGRQEAISPQNTPGAYPCSLMLTFSNIPLCAHFAPQAPFVQTVVAASPIPGSASLGTPYGLSSTQSPDINTLYRRAFGDPTPCRDGSFSLGATCASGGTASVSAGSILIDSFVDGGTSGPSQVRGSFQGLVLSPVEADPASGAPSLAAVGPIDRAFQATSCVVNLQPGSTLPVNF